MDQTNTLTDTRPRLPTFLADEGLKFIFFCGKGGVGKTTASTASATFLAQRRPTRKTLIFSIDPAHSVADSLACDVADRPTPVPGFDNLDAMEMDSGKLHALYMRRHENDLHELADRATRFGIHQLANVFSIAYPSSFAFMAMTILIDLFKSDKYDLIIVDTAPTGHMIMFIELLFELTGQLETMERSQEKHRYMVSRYAGQYRKDRPDRFLADLRKDVASFRGVLAGTRTEFVPVTIAEEMSIYETRRLITVLRRLRIWSVKNIIVNGLSPSSDCPFCAARSEEERIRLEAVRAEFPAYRLLSMPLFPQEVRGERLLDYAELLAGRTESALCHGGTCPAVPPTAGRVADAPKRGALAPSRRRDRPCHIEPAGPADENAASPVGRPATARVPESAGPFLSTLFAPHTDGARLAVFCGKGGVGKTTCAAATAVHAASSMPDDKLLVFSIDPAHSLSDSLAVRLTRRPEKVEGFNNLWAMEMDMRDSYQAFKEAYQKQVDEAFKRPVNRREVLGMGIQSGTDYTFDKTTLRELASVAPLGMDEFMALAHTVTGAQEEYDIIIVDTAPTGNLIDVLQRPDSILKWFTNIITGLRNYGGVMSSTFDLTKCLLDERRLLLAAHKLFADEKRTEFAAVAIPETMGVLETERLLSGLSRLRAAARTAIVNKMIPQSACRFCSSKREEQAVRLREMHEKFPDYQLLPMPLFPHQIRGIESLREFADMLFATRAAESRQLSLTVAK